MKAIKDWLLEKQREGVSRVSVSTVLKQIDETARQSNGRHRKLDLVGTAEAAELLDVERPRIGRWKKNGTLPTPVAELASGPVWFRSQIESVKEEREARRRRVAA